MTVSQLDSLITLLRSRPAPATQDVDESRARFEKMGGFLGGAPDAKCEKVDADGVPAEWVSAAGADAEPRGAVPAWRRLRDRLDQHPSAAGVRHLRGVGRAGAAARLSAGARASLPGRGRRRGDGVALAAEAGLRRRQAGDRRRFGRRRPHDRDAREPARPEARPAGLRRGDLAMGRPRRRRHQHDRARRHRTRWCRRRASAGWRTCTSPARMRARRSPRRCMPISRACRRSWSRSARPRRCSTTRRASPSGCTAAGGEVKLSVWPNMLHVFPLFAPILSEGLDGCRRDRPVHQGADGLDEIRRHRRPQRLRLEAVRRSRDDGLRLRLGRRFADALFGRLCRAGAGRRRTPRASASAPASPWRRRGSRR